MMQLKTILADGLSQRELNFLQKNIDADSSLDLVILNGTKADRERKILEFSPEECVLISADGYTVSRMEDAGMAVLGYLGTEQTGNTNQKMPGTVMLLEGLEEVDAQFLLRAYQRKHGLPWTILTTKRCIVREMTLDDLDALFLLYAGNGMTDYLEPLYEYEKEKEYQRSYIKTVYGFYGYGMWVVIEKSSQTLIGRVGIENREACDWEAELGYAIAVPYQKKGYASEVCAAVMDYAWKFLEFEKLNCLIHTGNTASLQLAKKLGFEFLETRLLDGVSMEHYVCQRSW